MRSEKKKKKKIEKKDKKEEELFHRYIHDIARSMADGATRLFLLQTPER